MAAPIGRPESLPPGPEALWDWMERRGVDQRETAQLIGIHYVTLNQILHNDYRPGLAAAIKIERVTGISPGLWMETGVSHAADAPLHDAPKR